jgi:3-oxoacyl-[acyl-carrier protein] reductase
MHELVRWIVSTVAHGLRSRATRTRTTPGSMLCRSEEPRRPTVFIDELSIDRHFTVNVRASALLIAEFARRYVARGAKWGRIISITTGGAECFPGQVSYGASKNALESYTRAAGKELARFGVTANLIVPGATQTGWITPELEKLILPDLPAGRIGQPEDIADAILMLASQQGRWINCATLFVDGGQGRSN